MHWLLFMLLGVCVGLPSLESLSLSAPPCESVPPKARVLIGCVVRQHPQIVRQFLSSVSQLAEQTCKLSYFFVQVCAEKESGELLEDFARRTETTCTIAKGRPEAEKESLWIWKSAMCKDQILDHARLEAYDYVLLVDPEILLHPHTVDHLIGMNKDIVANIVWTAGVDGRPAVPQVWLSDCHTQFEIAIQERISPQEQKRREYAFVERLLKPGLYDVGGVAGCTLISKRALDKGVGFRRIHNVTFQGEDCHFSLRAASMDIPLFVDTFYPAYRITSTASGS